MYYVKFLNKVIDSMFPDDCSICAEKCEMWIKRLHFALTHSWMVLRKMNSSILDG